MGENTVMLVRILIVLPNKQNYRINGYFSLYCAWNVNCLFYLKVAFLEIINSGLHAVNQQQEMAPWHCVNVQRLQYAEGVQSISAK